MILKPPAPFDFQLTAEIFSDGEPDIQRYEDGKFWQVIRVNGKLVLVTVRSIGDTEHPKLSIALTPEETLSRRHMTKIRSTVSRMLNLDFDLNTFYEQVKNEKRLTALTKKLRGLKSPTTPTAYEALIVSVIEQQISLDIAHMIENRLVRSFGDTVEIDGRLFYAFPTAQKLASASMPRLRKCGLSGRKSEYIREISALVAERRLDLENLAKNRSFEEILTTLDNVRGVGVWTAELTMVRGMQRLEALPADDLGLRRAVSHFYRRNRILSNDEVRKIAQEWGTWKGLAGFYIIVAERSGITP
jgi:DNA-3-methyladenine glycosylase II